MGWIWDLATKQELSWWCLPILTMNASQGVQVHLICATRGEAGTVDPKLLEGFESIGELREYELRCAAKQLDLSEVHFLNYRDSGMPGSPDNQHPEALVVQPTDQVAAEITSFIRRLRPQVVITFDPIGGYKHPDHIAIHTATVRAFQLAGKPEHQDGLLPYQPAKLYYHVFSKRMLKFYVFLLQLIGRDPRHFGRNRDIDLLSLVQEGDFPIHARINYHRVDEQRTFAFACHVSQLPGGPPNRGRMRWLNYLTGLNDTFMRAYPPAETGLKETDLFSGL
jgi:LmbE family N-acetylglucosaminyl deacetylase